MYWLISIVLAAAIGFIVRFASNKLISDDKTIVFIDEFVGQACSSVFIMELGIIGAEYGAPSGVLYSMIFIHFLLRNMYFAYANTLYDNPVAFLGAYYSEGRKMTNSAFKIMGVLATQVMALIAGQCFARFIWQFLDHAHVHAISAECHSALSQSHSWHHAAFLEAFGVFALVLVGLLSAQSKVQVLALSVTCTGLVTVLGHVSGQFMNGSIATAFSYRCKGHPEEWKFLAVYWVAPLVGMATAWGYGWEPIALKVFSKVKTSKRDEGNEGKKIE